MALKALKCPNCDANIHIDDDRAYGFCSYCGAQIQVSEIVESRKTSEDEATKSFEKYMKDGDLQLKFGDYYWAEMVFMEAIYEYPSHAKGYEMLIKTITRDYTLFLEENQERVFTLVNKMCVVACPEEIDYYEKLKTYIFSAYLDGLELQKEANIQRKIETYDKKINKNLKIFVVAFIYSILMFIAAKEFLFFLIMGLMSGGVMVKALINIVVYIKKKDELSNELY